MVLVPDLKQGIELAVESNYDKIMPQCQERDKVYEEIKSLERIASTSRRLDGETRVFLEQRLEDRKKEIAEAYKEKPLVLDCLANYSPERLEIVLPVPVENPGNLLHDLSEYVGTVLRKDRKKTMDGRFGKYFTICSPNRDMTAALKKELESLPDQFKKLNVGLELTKLSADFLLGEYEGMQRKLSIKMTNASIEYPHIPLRKGHRGFFPGYHKTFVLESPYGPMNAWVTSGSVANSEGKYVCSRGRENGEDSLVLGTVYENLKIKPGQHLKITILEPKKRYRIDGKE